MIPLDPRRMPRPADPELAERHRERWLEAVAGDALLRGFAQSARKDAGAAALLEAVFGNSPYLSQSLAAEPDLLRRLLTAGPDATLRGILDAARRQPAADTPSLMRLLREGKRRAALLIGLADIAGLWSLEEVCHALSRTADTALERICAHLLHSAQADGELRLPHPDSPTRGSGLVVLAMGKLGADELNYSSDIDLIALYDDEKVDYRGARSVQELFVAMTRELVHVLEERTEDGYVFRADLRLRPDPGATPLALSLAAAETYYESMGQNWERAALIKARAAAGDLDSGDSILRFLQPFIWRRHLDFAAIQDIHSIKRQIDAHRGMGRIAVAGHDIKLGRGGIREIEFFAQTQQLIRGGRDPALRSPRTLEALAALAAAGHVTRAVADELSAAYRFLRVVEHRLQMIDDRQTQRLPEEPDRLAAVAAFAGFPDVEGFDKAMRHALGSVERHYARLFEDAPPLAPKGNLVFTGADDDPDTLETLRAMGFADPSFVCARIRGWHHGRVSATRSARARETLTEITPGLLAALARGADPDAAFHRFDALLSALPVGVPLFSLLYANPPLLDLVAEIMGNAPRLAEALSRRPDLLDGVLSPWFYDPLPSGAALAAELGRQLDRAGDDVQDVMDAARRWTQEQKFRVGMQILRGLLRPEAAAENLSDLADAVLGELAPRVEAEFARRHGRVAGRGAVLLAMGKLGSREMTANSDLDLILVYDAARGVEASDGPKPLSPGTYYARLTQRLIAVLTARTGEGVLYEADMRLRPSGSSGPIATSLDAFRRYHRADAWTWEHMALTRARVITGAPSMRAAVRRAIRETLARPRDAESLRADVAEMRARMEREIAAGGEWEVKHRPGGLVDIEFIAQYLQLRWAHAHPSILKGATQKVLAEARRLGLLAPRDADRLLRAARLWTAIQQLLRQAIEGAPADADIPVQLRGVLARAAGCADFAQLKQEIEARAIQVRAIFDRMIAHPPRQTARRQAHSQEKRT